MFQKTHDSNQSLSEEEEEVLSYDTPENFAVSLSVSFENKGHGIQVLSQLEKLQKDSFQLDHGTNKTILREHQRQNAPHMEDEIEFPAFKNEEDVISSHRNTSMLDMVEESMHDQRLSLPSVCISDEEIMSNDEKTDFHAIESVTRYGERDAWIKANQEVEALLQLNGSSLISSKEHKFIKDGRRKAKPEILFHFRSQKEDIPPVVSDKSENVMVQTDLQQTKELESGANGDIQKSMAEPLGILSGRGVGLYENAVPLRSVRYHDCNGNSVAEFLDNLQEKCGYLQKSSEQRKTMADQFHEALGTLPPNNVVSEVKLHTQLGFGLFDKLQHVMLSGKEKDMDYLERSNVDDSFKDGSGCIDVRILSRTLEAKHNVCCCAVMRHEKSSQLVNDLDTTEQIRESTLTVIFSSRICGDVELEVGNAIRIQPPWKKVKVSGQDHVILLSTYFFQLGP